MWHPWNRIERDIFLNPDIYAVCFRGQKFYRLDCFIKKKKVKKEKTSAMQQVMKGIYTQCAVTKLNNFKMK